MITSCETSTRRRVRYPESAVRSAVSARPLRAPWVEMKYSSTDRPSMKFALIGRSMISPFGFASSPACADLLERAARSRVGHHEDRVQLEERLLHRVGDGVRPLRPDVDNALVPLLLGNQPALVLGLDLGDPL